MSNIGNKETMAKNLLYYLDKSGMTQKEMAEIVGVATSTFNDWMKARKYPRIDKIEIMANHWKILKSDLIEEKTTEHREMQKNNDILSDIIIRAKTDKDFFALLETINKYDIDKIKMLSAFLKQF